MKWTFEMCFEVFFGSFFSLFYLNLLSGVCIETLKSQLRTFPNSINSIEKEKLFFFWLSSTFLLLYHFYFVRFFYYLKLSEIKRCAMPKWIKMSDIHLISFVLFCSVFFSHRRKYRKLFFWLIFEFKIFVDLGTVDFLLRDNNDLVSRTKSSFSSIECLINYSS